MQGLTPFFVRLLVTVRAITRFRESAGLDEQSVFRRSIARHGYVCLSKAKVVVLTYARIVLDLQSIVSREVNPTDPAVVTVGSIHGGTKHNIIPNEVKLQLTVRTTTTTTRDRVLKAIDRIAKAAAVGANAPPPEVKLNLDEFTEQTGVQLPDGPYETVNEQPTREQSESQAAEHAERTSGAPR